MNNSKLQYGEIIPRFGMIKYYSRRRKRVMSIERKKLYISIFVLSTFLALVCTGYVLYNIISSLNSEIDYLQKQLIANDAIIQNMTEENEQLKQEISSIQDTLSISYNIVKDAKVSISSYEEVINEQNDIITELVNDNTNLSNEYDAISEAYNTLKNRAELYDKYSYALIYNGARTELTYDQLEYGEQLMLSKGLDPDLLFSIGMVESRYNPSAINPKSLASGYHQFLSGTGKFAYEVLLGNGNGTYNHSITPFNGTINIEMAVAYLDYLHNNYNSIRGMIECYSGRTGYKVDEYIGYMNEFLNKKGKYVSDIKY